MSSEEIHASGDKSASGWGSVVLRSKKTLATLLRANPGEGEEEEVRVKLTAAEWLRESRVSAPTPAASRTLGE
jgi:hypothetical protein